MQLGLLFRDESDTTDIVVSAIEQGSLADQDGALSSQSQSQSQTVA